LKREHLPPIVRGEIRWCQGYSEPGAGSDLAGLQTRAVRDGDVFVLNGQKVWTSFADKADWMFILVRTDFEAPKHSGITFLLMDMETPGVTVRPIKLISGSSPFCETFLADVRVPVRNVVGRMNGGWLLAKALLRRELMVETLGPQALGWEGPGFADEELKVTRDWLRSRGNSIEGGTSEVQLNIIAKRVLGLPD